MDAKKTRLPDDHAWFHAASVGDARRLRELIARGDVDVDARDSHGDTAVVLAAAAGSAACLISLIAAGAGVDLRAPGGRTAAMIAAQNGHAKFLRRLIDAGCEIDATAGGKGSRAARWTAAGLAAACGQAECLRMLLEAGASLDGKVEGKPWVDWAQGSCVELIRVERARREAEQIAAAAPAPAASRPVRKARAL